MSGPRGPAPTPTEILKLRGSRLVREREKRNEPQPELGRPDRPENLDGDAGNLWEQVAGMLDDVGVLSKIDGWQLERYCLMFVQWRQLQRIISGYSNDAALRDALADDATRPVIRNAWAESHRLDHALKQIEMQFGLTPASRARLSTNGESGKDEESIESFIA